MTKAIWKKGISAALAAAMMAGTVSMPVSTVKAAQIQQQKQAQGELPDIGDLKVVNGMVYATVDMEYADFYYGELKNISPDAEPSSAGLDLTADKVGDAGYRAEGVYDAVTSATTTGKGKSFGNLDYEEFEDKTVSIKGLKDVTIAIPQSLYEKYYASKDSDSVKNAKAYTYLKKAAFLTADTAPDKFKVLNADGTFSKLVKNGAEANTYTEPDTLEASDAEVVQTAGSSAWGNYQLTVENLPSTVTKSNMLGVIMTMENGEVYGFQHLDNLWLQPKEIAFAVKEFTEPHGNSIRYQKFASLLIETNKEARTVKQIKYLLQGAEDVVINTDVYLKDLVGDDTAGTAQKAVYNSNGTKIPVAFSGLLEGSDYTLSKIKKGRKQTLSEDLYSYSNGVITLDKTCTSGSDYTAVFTSTKYSDLQVPLTVDKAEQTVTGTGVYTKTFGDGTFQLDAKAPAGDLSFDSSDSKVAAVDANGKVTVKGAGTAVITIKATGDDYYNAAEKKVTVTVKKKNAVVSAKAFTKAYGSKAFSLGVKTNGASLSYKSSNAKIVSVASNGKVTIKGTGKAAITITASGANYNTATKKVTITVVPKKQSISKLKSSKKKQVTVQWKKDTKVSGYQIKLSTNKKFSKAKTVNVKSYKTYKKVVKSLKSKKKYYVKVRAYKTSGSTKLYGAYSNAKTIKVK